MSRITHSRAPRLSGSASRTLGFASNSRAVFLVLLAVPLTYATVLLAVICLYRRGYGIAGKPELALRFVSTNVGRLRSRARDRRTVDAMVRITRKLTASAS